MKHIPLPKKFTVEESVAGKKAKVVIEPCFPGYGLTLGNALRRAMLSSLPGGAITSAKIKGVKHEFSTIENVPDDVLEIVLNLKTLRFKVYSDEPVTLHLKASGKGEVTGADIENSVDAEVVNKEAVITTLTDDKANLEMELNVSKGIGYVTAEEQLSGKGEIGHILLDSIFTPVINVGLSVEATRVGQKTDYDRLVLDVETDGTISPEDAVKKASEILNNQFTWIMEGGSREVEEVNIEEPVAVPERAEEDNSEVVSSSTEETENESAEEEGEEKPKKRGRPKKSEVEEE
ncbi:MAG: DNA-directed RNA polymerase subunit alpha [Parcubacteria group bacterium ADurb.Bin326]|nr:MAG: DNA-directed RNA polymerase subunit alpha [Parcubacteria group bacterium ADurb.Bin326]